MFPFDVVTLVVVAQSAGDPDWTDLAQYGVLGLVVLAFIFGKIVPGYIYERRVKEHTSEKEENRRLEATIKDKVIPALVQSTDVMAQVLVLLDRFDGLDEQRRRPPSRKAP